MIVYFASRVLESRNSEECNFLSRLYSEKPVMVAPTIPPQTAATNAVTGNVETIVMPPMLPTRLTVTILGISMFDFAAFMTFNFAYTNLYAILDAHKAIIIQL